MTPTPRRRVESNDPPLFAGEIHGVRRWKVRRNRLVAPFRDTEWRPGRPLRAECDLHADPPYPGCGCGLYAFHPHVVDIDAHAGEVFGVIEAWGRIEVHAEGFRAEYARPAALFWRAAEPESERRRIERLAKRYGCAAIPLGRGESLAQACASRGWGIKPHAVAELVGVAYEDELRTGAGRRATARARGAALPSGRAIPVRARRTPGFLERLGEGLITVGQWAAIAVMVLVGAAAWLAIYGGVAAAFVLGALSLFGVDVLGEDGGPRQPPLERAREVEVTGAWTVDFADGKRVHVAELANHGDHAAFGARPAMAERADGERDEIGALNIDVRANLAPGQRGLALHPVASDDPEASVDTGRVWAREGPTGTRAPARLRVWIARTRRGCVALARIHAERPLRILPFWALAIVDGQPERVIRDAVRDIPAGRSRRVIGRAGRCPDPIPRFRTYPAFSRKQISAEAGLASNSRKEPKASPATTDEPGVGETK